MATAAAVAAVVVAVAAVVWYKHYGILFSRPSIEELFIHEWTNILIE